MSADPQRQRAEPTRSGERLQKVMAYAGVASRRKCEALILAGRVQVNGQVVRGLGVRVRPEADRILVDGQPIVMPQVHQYYLLYKPVGYLSTVSDPHGRAALELVPSKARLYPVGRLDLDSEGLLLFTDDGPLAQRLTHPRYEHEKEYLVLTEGALSAGDAARLREGLRPEGQEKALRAAVEILPPRWTWRGQAAPQGCGWVRVILREGHKRQIRLMLQALGYRVRQLIRVRMANLRLGDLAPSQGRWLSPAEVRELRRFAGLEPSGGGRGA